MDAEPAHPPTLLEWRVEAVSDAVRIVVGEGRRKIILARLCPPQLSENETWANARLMRAAPELLKAAEKMLEALHSKSRSAADEVLVAEGHLKDAIKKARGNQNGDVDERS